MSKNSFTLFEVLISLIILSVTLVFVTKYSFSDNSLQTYYELQTIENNYIENGIISNNSNIKFKNN